MCEKQRERQRERGRERGREREGERDIESETEWDRERERDRERQRVRGRERQREREREREKESEREWENKNEELKKTEWQHYIKWVIVNWARTVSTAWWTKVENIDTSDPHQPDQQSRNIKEMLWERKLCINIKLERVRQREKEKTEVFK